jgi:hypothetical protein
MANYILPKVKHYVEALIDPIVVALTNKYDRNLKNVNDHLEYVATLVNHLNSLLRTFHYTTIIDSNASWEYDSWEDYGTDSDLRMRYVKVYVLDTTEGSTNGMFVGAEGIATISIIDNRYLQVVNRHNEPLTFSIVVK